MPLPLDEGAGLIPWLMPPVPPHRPDRDFQRRGVLWSGAQGLRNLRPDRYGPGAVSRLYQHPGGSDHRRGRRFGLGAQNGGGPPQDPETGGGRTGSGAPDRTRRGKPFPSSLYHDRCGARRRPDGNGSCHGVEEPQSRCGEENGFSEKGCTGGCGGGGKELHRQAEVPPLLGDVDDIGFLRLAEMDRRPGRLRGQELQAGDLRGAENEHKYGLLEWASEPAGKATESRNDMALVRFLHNI
ncbi:MAG: hypothetical protein PWQ99_156 [Clostridia bacterium]|nr:hypothetical protein [Clostridia bacterium]